MPALDLVLPGDPATLTGGYLYDRRIVEGLTRLGWATRVLALPDDFPCAGKASLRAAEGMLDAIPDGRIVVVDGLALADLAVLLERHAARLELIALVHHPLADETGLDAPIAARLRDDERRAWNAVRGVIVTSRWTAQRLARSGCRAERIRVVEPGTNRPELRDDAAARRPELRDGDTVSRADPRDGDAVRPRDPREHDTPTASPRLLCVATLTERKGHAVLLDALARIADRPWRLDCVGSATRDPTTAAEIAARIARHALGARVVLHGEVSPAALDAHYRSARAFVLPSYLEGYGMALADALAHGVPIVGSSAGAIPETVGDAGLLVPPGDAAALAAALAQMLDDDALHAELSARARRRGLALPTWEGASARFAAAVGDLLGLRTPPPSARQRE